jgi:D-alanyl-D-alanine carboxypeptidase
MLHSALLVAVLSLSTSGAPAATDAAIARQAQAVLDATVRTDGPGAVVLIARGDRVILRSARGRAQIELDVPMQPEHVFRIASVTKIFTAAAILKLAEQGRLSLDDPLATHLPDLSAAGRVTIRQLLTHAGGIPESSAGLPGSARRGTDRASRIAEIGARPLAFEPGSRWSYSNAGYILLGAVIERVTGEPWPVAMQKAFFDPLGLTHTRYGDPAPIVPRRAAGYTTEGASDSVRNVVPIDAAVPDAAGALVSTADDLLHWMRALTHGRAIDGASYQRMVTASGVPPAAPTRDRYGFGVYVWQIRGATVIGHTGQIPGFASVVAYLPEQDVTIVVLANDDNFDARLMGRRLAAIAMGSPFPAVVPATASAETLQALAGVYRIDETTTRTLTIRDGRLYAKRGSGNVIPLQITAAGQLHFDPDFLSYFVPVRDASGGVVALDYFQDGEGPAQSLPRIGGAAPP